MERISSEHDKFGKRIKHLTSELWTEGNVDLLVHFPTISVVGSRECPLELLDIAEEIGKMAATHEMLLVSGDALGVDRSAQNGAYKAGGKVLLVLPHNLRSRVDSLPVPVDPERTLIISHRKPDASWSTAAAHHRNRIIYALGDVSVVVACVEGKGGSWAGATRALEEGHKVLVYTGPYESQGAKALTEKGAIPFDSVESLEDYLIGEEVIA